MTYQQYSREISITPVGIGSIRNTASKLATSALSSGKIRWTASSGRGGTGFYVQAKDEARANAILKRDARVHSYTFTMKSPPTSLENKPHSSIILVATVHKSAFAFVKSTLHAASIPCTVSSSQSKGDIWILDKDRNIAIQALKADAASHGYKISLASPKVR